MTKPTVQTDPPHPLETLLAWHSVPGQHESHARFTAIAHLPTAVCGHWLGLQAGPDTGSRCGTCQLATSTMHETYLRWPREHVFTNHPLVALIAASFEAAGGRWAALQRLPLRRRQVHREMEATVRGNYDNPQALLREVLGYLDLAMDAARREAVVLQFEEHHLR